MCSFGSCPYLITPLQARFINHHSPHQHHYHMDDRHNSPEANLNEPLKGPLSAAVTGILSCD